MNTRLSALFAGCTLVVGAACGGGSSTGGSSSGASPLAPTPPPPPVAPPPPAPPPDQRVEPPIGSAANFDIIDDSFVDANGKHDQEATASVASGKMVTWTQNGHNIHRVEFSQVPQGATAPDSRDLRPGSTWSFRPTVPGKYVFFCRYHEYMMDVVVTVGGG